TAGGIRVIDNNAANANDCVPVAVEVPDRRCFTVDMTAPGGDDQAVVGDRGDQAAYFNPLHIQDAAVDLIPIGPQRFRILTGSKDRQVTTFDPRRVATRHGDTLDLTIKPERQRPSGTRWQQVFDINTAGFVLHTAVTPARLKPRHHAAQP